MPGPLASGNGDPPALYECLTITIFWKFTAIARPDVGLHVGHGISPGPPVLLDVTYQWCMQLVAAGQLFPFDLPFPSALQRYDNYALLLFRLALVVISHLQDENAFLTSNEG